MSGCLAQEIMHVLYACMYIYIYIYTHRCIHAYEARYYERFGEAELLVQKMLKAVA